MNSGGPLLTAINSLHVSDISSEVLRKTFVFNGFNGSNTDYSLNERNLANVIRPRLLVDIAYEYGTEIIVPLGLCEYQKESDFEHIYRVPKTLTGGRSILSPTEMVMLTGTALSMVMGFAGDTGNIYGGSLAKGAQNLLNANNTLPYTKTANAQLIGENVVFITHGGILNNNVALRCIVQNDEDSHFPPGQYEVLRELVVSCVKAYIYKYWRIKKGLGTIQAGSSLDSFDEEVESYRDQEEIYLETLKTKYGRVSLMTDKPKFRKHIRLLGGAKGF